MNVWENIFVGKVEQQTIIIIRKYASKTRKNKQNYKNKHKTIFSDILHILTYFFCNISQTEKSFPN